MPTANSRSETLIFLGSNKSGLLPREGEPGARVRARWQGSVLIRKGTVLPCPNKERRTGPVIVARVSHSPGKSLEISQV